MSTKLKICGLTTLADARYCAGAGVDFLGFIFHPQSPRAVEPQVVRSIAEWIHGPEIVGVFVDQSPERVANAASEARLTMVQLHGSETPEDCAQLSLPIIKAFRVSPIDDASVLRERMLPFDSVVDYFLLDTYHAAAAGGTGEVFDWRIAAELAREFPLFLSGGIDASNVREAVDRVRPLAIDLSSGVESRPGSKDFDLVGQFLEVFDEVRGVDPVFSS